MDGRDMCGVIFSRSRSDAQETCGKHRTIFMSFGILLSAAAATLLVISMVTCPDWDNHCRQCSRTETAALVLTAIGAVSAMISCVTACCRINAAREKTGFKVVGSGSALVGVGTLIGSLALSRTPCSHYSFASALCLVYATGTHSLMSSEQTYARIPDSEGSSLKCPGLDLQKSGRQKRSDSDLVRDHYGPIIDSSRRLNENANVNERSGLVSNKSDRVNEMSAPVNPNLVANEDEETGLIFNTDTRSRGGGSGRSGRTSNNSNSSNNNMNASGNITASSSGSAVSFASGDKSGYVSEKSGYASDVSGRGGTAGETLVTATSSDKGGGDVNATNNNSSTSKKGRRGGRRHNNNNNNHHNSYNDENDPRNDNDNNKGSDDNV